MASIGEHHPECHYPVTMCVCRAMWAADAAELKGRVRELEQALAEARLSACHEPPADCDCEGCRRAAEAEHGGEFHEPDCGW